MCGICGLISASPLAEKDLKLVGEMNKALAHRGPDSSGAFHDEHAVLAMRRLKIIDLVGGDQPLFNEDGSLVLIANGEIYNHVELREELERRGHVFRTGSDCEVILHLYEEAGRRCVSSLRGMFAFALYDTLRGELLLARDRLSEKPLYYYHCPEGVFAFASELKSLLVFLRTKGFRMNHRAIHLYFLHQYVPEPLTCLEGVFKLPAAHLMTVSARNPAPDCHEYWNLEDAEPVEGNPADLIRESFDELSRIIIRADVPVGISLSGGIDSGAIASYASKYYRDNMHAFSVGYSGHPPSDERAMAQQLAETLGLNFHEVELSTADLAREFPRVVFHMDDPIADIAAYGYFSVHRLARQHGVPVLLGGLGGDELFWGYEWVRTAVERSLAETRWKEGPGKTVLHSLLRAGSGLRPAEALAKPLATARGILAAFRKDRVLLRANPEGLPFYEELPGFLITASLLSRLATREFRQHRNEGLPFSFAEGGDFEDIPLKACSFLFKTWLYSNCVALSDRMSMASSVENRLPFLDYKFVELTMGLRKTHADDFRLGYKRWFLDAMKGIMPEEVLERRKMGFTPPVEEWYRAIVADNRHLWRDGYLVSGGLLDVDRLADLFKAPLGGFELFFAYKIVLFEMWHAAVVRGEGHA